MIQLTDTEAIYIEEVLQEVLDVVENRDIIDDDTEIRGALNIIQSCNVYSEEEMITLDEGYTEEAIDAEYPNNQ